MSELKPDPYEVGKYVSLDTTFGGQGYLWATHDNVLNVKKGNYSRITPVAAEFDLSTSCIYHCPWCAYRESKMNAANVLHDDAKAIEIVEELSRSGVFLLTLTGGGEPLLSKCVESTIKSARIKNMSVVLYTNGFLLRKQRSENLIKSGISEIRISLNDISSQKGYDAAHGAPTNNKLKLEVVINNLIDLLRAKKLASANLKIGASFVLVDNSAKNLKSSLDHLICRLKDEGLALDYTIVRPAVDYWPQDRCGYSAFLTRPLEAMDMVEDTLESRIGCRELGSILFSPQRFQAIEQEKTGAAYEKCLAFQTWLNVGPDGTAYICCETKHDGKYSLGNIRQCRNVDCISCLMEAPIAIHMRDDYGATLHCPTRLCKPSAYNIVFSQIESLRNKKTGVLPEVTNRWLDDVEREAKKTRDELKKGNMLSVSGIYRALSMG